MANEEIRDRETWRARLLGFTSLALALGLTPAHAGDLELPRSVISGGGGASQSRDNVRLDATVGQPTAGANLSGGRFSMQLGFWPALPPAFEIVSAVSRKAHGTAGTFDIPLPRTGAAGVECRTGGTGGNYRVVVTFASAVTVGGLSVMSIDGQATGTHTVADAVVTIELAGVSNAQTLGITLTNVTSGTAVGDVFVAMGVLAGDTNGNGAVTASDIGQTKAVSGQLAGGANFRTDVNASGGITASDIGLVKSRAGTQLP